MTAYTMLKYLQNTSQVPLSIIKKKSHFKTKEKILLNIRLQWLIYLITTGRNFQYQLLLIKQRIVLLFPTNNKREKKTVNIKNIINLFALNWKLFRELTKFEKVCVHKIRSYISRT